MLKYTDYDIVFQEIPDEVTLAVNLSLCPNHCPGCHSPQLQQDLGEPLTEEVVDGLLARYGGSVTCLCLMGGDGDAASVARLAHHLRTRHPALRTAWYSGRAVLPDDFPEQELDYLKLGPYIEARGSLRSPTTNQRLYRLSPKGVRTDLTPHFWRAEPE